jgi:hypothetical protein
MESRRRSPSIPQQRDLVMLGQLRSLGIEKGKEFKPNEETRVVLRSPVQEAHKEFVKALLEGSEPGWPGSAIGVCRTHLALQRKLAFHSRPPTISILMPVRRSTCWHRAKLGEASFYLVSYRDAAGQSLEGGASYRLRIPSNVPAQQFWAAPRVGVDSCDQKVAQECRRLGRRVLRSCRACRSGSKLGLHGTRNGLVGHVPVLRPGQITVREDLEVARNREGELMRLL